MSRSGMFEGLTQEVLGTGEREHYEPGIPRSYSGLIKAILDEHFSDSKGFAPSRYFSDNPYGVERYELFLNYTQRFASCLEAEPKDEFKPHLFLDQLLRTLGEMPQDDLTWKPIDTLLSPLVQALYDLGHNNFLLDVSHLPAEPDRILSFLVGKPGSPLEIAYTGVCDRLGDDTSFVRIAASGTVRHTAGHQGRESEYVLGGITENRVGTDAERSTFWLPTIRSVSAKANDCTFHITREGEDEGWEHILDHDGFYARGNTLLVPDGAGSWKEVLR